MDVLECSVNSTDSLPKVVDRRHLVAATVCDLAYSLALNLAPPTRAAGSLAVPLRYDSRARGQLQPGDGGGG